MRTIQKYELRPDKFVLEMPKGAVLLSVHLQDGWFLPPRDPAGAPSSAWGDRYSPVLLALVDPDAPKVKRNFVMVDTDHVLPDEISEFQYVGTVLLIGGRLVLHLFDAGELDAQAQLRHGRHQPRPPRRGDQ